MRKPVDGMLDLYNEILKYTASKKDPNSETNFKKKALFDASVQISGFLKKEESTYKKRRKCI